MQQAALLMLFWFLILASSSIAENVAPRNAYEAPAGSVRLCGGHVTGAPSPDGTPGPHISWEAYTSTQPVEVLSKQYLKMLHSASHSSDKDCHHWSSTSQHPDQILEVCDVKYKGVWSGCGEIPADASSVILISRITRPQ